MAILNGAYAVVVGGAISRPQQTTARFVKHISDLPSSDITAVGVDLGGTWTRSVLTDMYGNILKSYRQETPKNAASVLACIEKCIEKVIDGKTTAIGIASAGRIDFKNGKVLYASDNLPGWTGTEVKNEIEKEGTGSIYKAINKTKLLNFKIPHPPLPEQQKRAAVLSAVQEAKERPEAVIKATKA